MKTMPAGSRKGFERHGLSDEQLVTMLRNMLLQRQLDNRGFQLNRQGKIPFALGSEGHEAMQAGAAMALDRGARSCGPVLSRHRAAHRHRRSAARRPALDVRARRRQVGRAAVPQSLHEQSARRHLDQLDHRGPSAARGRDRVLVQIPQGERPRGRRDLRRRLHERRRVARVDELRVGPQAADRVPVREQRLRDLGAARAIRWRSRTSRCAPPATACRAKSSTASIRSRPTRRSNARSTAPHSGGGPTLVEAKCYRFLSHSTDDDDRTYRDREIRQRNAAKTTLSRRYENFLIEHGVLTAAAIAKLKRAVLRETNDATDLAESMPLPVPSDLYTNVHEGAYEPWQ